jgi:hypothetical protein
LIPFQVLIFMGNSKKGVLRHPLAKVQGKYLHETSIPAKPATNAFVPLTTTKDTYRTIGQDVKLALGKIAEFAQENRAGKGSRL